MDEMTDDEKLYWQYKNRYHYEVLKLVYVSNPFDIREIELLVEDLAAGIRDMEEILGIPYLPN